MSEHSDSKLSRRTLVKGATASGLLLPLTASHAANMGDWGANATPYLTGNFGPVAEETTLTDLKVIGDLPKDLVGRYVRNGPNPSGQVDPKGHHWFIGDGMVHGIRVENGKALWYRNRYVKGGPNTHVIGHAGKTLAIVEAGQKPTELTDELESVGSYDFGGTLQTAFSAHPKRDPDTGELHVMTYNPGPPPFKVHYVVVDAGGKVTKTLAIPTNGPSMVHDIAVSQKYVVVFDFPVLANPGLIQQGYRFPFQWQPEYGSRVGLLPKNGTAEDVVWIDAPLAYVFHPMNAYDTADGKLVVDVCRYDRMFDGNFNGPFDSNAELTLDRWTLDPAARTCKTDRIDDRPQEFPRAHPALESKSYRYGYTVALEDNAFPTILKHDMEKGTAAEHRLSKGRSSGEALFVPREGSTAEDDGYLLSWVFDANTDTSDFLVVDAASMEERARVPLPVRVPYGFHGSWIAS